MTEQTVIKSYDNADDLMCDVFAQEEHWAPVRARHAQEVNDLKAQVALLEMRVSHLLDLLEENECSMS